MKIAVTAADEKKRALLFFFFAGNRDLETNCFRLRKWIRDILAYHLLCVVEKTALAAYIDVLSLISLLYSYTRKISFKEKKSI